MRQTKILSAAAVAMMFAIPAYAAECDTNLRNLNEKVSKNENNYRSAASGRLSSDLRQLRTAAQTLAANGQEGACEEVVQAMNEMLDQRNAEMKSSGKAVNQEEWTKTEIDRMKSARSVNDWDGQVRAASVIGADVRNAKNNNLGEIEDIVLDPKDGKIQMVIMSHGGFLGMGEEKIAVPWQELKVAGDKEDRVFILNVSEESLKNAPRFKRDNWSMIGDDAWRKKNQQYYEQNRM